MPFSESKVHFLSCAMQAAEMYVKGVISDLLNNRIDMSLLVVSKVGCMGAWGA